MSTFSTWLVSLTVLPGCTNAEVRAVRSMPINHVDLSQVKDGDYSGDYTCGGFGCEVKVTVANSQINDIARQNGIKKEIAGMSQPDVTDIQEKRPPGNHATRITVSLLGVLLGIGGLDHGILEAMQGNTSTAGFLINALGAGNSWSLWKQGGEGAFTVIPNFLLTGIVSIVTGVIIIVWSVGFIHRRYGNLVLLLLCISLFMVGGGVAQVLFIAITFAVSTRIHEPLNWWRIVLPTSLRRVIAKVWPGTLIAFVLLFLVALEMAVIGFVPGMHDQQMVLHTTWVTLGAAILLLLFSIVSGFAFDIERNGQR